jgi:hypothetical protein
MADNKQIFPWGLHPMDPWIKEELDKRAQEYDLNPTSNIKTEIYSGPKTAWGRVFSNGIGSTAPNLEGFVMGGTEGFDESYGFGLDGNITIGVDAYGKNHTLKSFDDPILKGSADFPHRPPPSIVSMTSEFSGGSNSSFGALCRKTTINWKCYSLAQLEYLTPYFLTPRISILAEWGWNHYDTMSLVDLTDIEWLYGIFEGTPEYTSLWIEKSRGNYDLAMGFITDYTYSLNEYGGYDCTTTITNANYLIEGKSYQVEKSFKTNEKSGSIQLKDFSEFVLTDIENLGIKNKKTKTVVVKDETGAGTYTSATNFAAMKAVNPVKTIEVPETADTKIPTRGRIFKNNDDAWMKMDLVVDIINYFFTRDIIDTNNHPTRISFGKLDINEVAVVAHPALKSTSKNFIIPNQFAPRFVSKEGAPKNAVTGQVQKQTLSTAKPSAQGDYFQLFPNISSLMKENKLDETYDDLVKAMNTKGAECRSFPMYSDYTDLGANNSPKAGYWGYLSDIFVSVSYFKKLVEKNDTVLKLIQELLSNISTAMCDISQLKCNPPNNNNNTIYTIQDVNFSSINSKEDAEDLMRISLGSVNSAFMKSAEFSIKLSVEMSNQMVMQSASGKELPAGYGTTNHDPKTMIVSKFSRGDRMFDRGVIPRDKIIPSNNAAENKLVKYKRQFTDQNTQFYLYEHNAKPLLTPFFATVNDLRNQPPSETFILTETDSSFLKNILLDTRDKKAVYTNNGIMPGTEFKMELLGIGGITFLSQFTLEHVPSSYNYERCVWQVSQVSQKIENKIWTTTVTAQARPLTVLNK